MTTSALLPVIATVLAVTTGTAEIDVGRSARLLASEDLGQSEASPESGSGRQEAIVANTNGSCLNLRPTPETVVPALTCVPEGTRLTIIESVPGWRKARLGDGRLGWVAAEFLGGLRNRAEEKPETEVAGRSHAELEVRPEPPVAEPRDHAANPSAVRVPEARNEDLTASDAGSALIVLESADPCLNFRSDPSSAGKVFECLVPGTVLGSVGRFDGWRYVELDDNRAGWVSAQHVGPFEMSGGDGAHF